jgi:transcriptional regulator with XRE-family HTH domain
MHDLYAKRTNPVKDDCTPAVLYGDKTHVHDAYMSANRAKKVVPRFKEALFRPTFIKQWRKKSGLTQEQLAERVAVYLAEHGDDSGYTHASIGRLENGKVGYTQVILEAVADALGTDPASLLIRDPSESSGIWTVWERALPAERQIITEQAEIVVKNRRKSA